MSRRDRGRPTPPRAAGHRQRPLRGSRLYEGAATAAKPSGVALREALAAGARQAGVALTAEQLERLLGFQALLEKWNRIHNLTALRDAHAVVALHILDSLAIVPALRNRAASTPGRPLRVLDAGSGAGLPGVVVAIAMADAEVCCIDAVAKKVAFIRQVAAELGLQNLTAEHARVEALEAGPFDVVVSRAFSSLADFVRLTRRHVAANGVWLAMKAHRPEDELAGLPPDAEMFHVEPIVVPGVAAQRCLVWLRPR